MSNGLLAVVVLVAAGVGALLPLIVLLTIAAFRAGREISEIGAQLRRTLAQVDVVSQRVEVLSRGLEGGEKSIAELLATVGSISRGLDRNLQIANVVSALVASAGGALASYLGTRPTGEDTGQVAAPEGDGASPRSPADSH